MNHSKSSARREWSPSLTNRIPETHVSPPITSDISGHTDEQNEFPSQSSHKSQQAAEQNKVPGHLSNQANKAASQSTHLGGPADEAPFQSTHLGNQAGEAPSQSTYLGDQADEARTYLRDLLAGHLMCYEPIKFKMPFVSWWKLTSDPEFQLIIKEIKTSYDTVKSVFTIYPMKGKRHAHSISWVTELAILAKHNLDISISEKIFFASDDTLCGFEGKWAGSSKDPDFLVAWEDNGGTEMHTVVEVGASQSKESLHEVMELYLKGAPQVSRVILINITETPKYRGPNNFDIDELKNIEKAGIQVDSEQGPVWYKGIQWVGHNTISWDVWERDPKSGDPVQIFEATIVPNDSGSQLPFFEIPTRIADGVKPVTVKPADVDSLWHRCFRVAIKDEAVRRMKDYVHRRKEEAEEAAHTVRQKQEADEKAKKADAVRAERAQHRSRN